MTNTEREPFLSKFEFGGANVNVKNARKLIVTLWIAGFVLSMLGGAYVPLLIAGIIVIVSSLIPHFLYNKCPHCGKNLGRNEGRFCQFCGKEWEVFSRFDTIEFPGLSLNDRKNRTRSKD